MGEAVGEVFLRFVESAGELEARPEEAGVVVSDESALALGDEQPVERHEDFLLGAGHIFECARDDTEDEIAAERAVGRGGGVAFEAEEAGGVQR